MDGFCWIWRLPERDWPGGWTGIFRCYWRVAVGYCDTIPWNPLSLRLTDRLAQLTTRLLVSEATRNPCDA
jgi:hypothetical protein